MSFETLNCTTSPPRIIRRCGLVDAKKKGADPQLAWWIDKLMSLWRNSKTTRKGTSEKLKARNFGTTVKLILGSHLHDSTQLNALWRRRCIQNLPAARVTQLNRRSSGSCNQWIRKWIHYPYTSTGIVTTHDETSKSLNTDQVPSQSPPQGHRNLGSPDLGAKFLSLMQIQMHDASSAGSSFY